MNNQYLKPCSDYDNTSGTCKAGHVRTHPICRGVVTGCRSCGAGDVPMCMMDDQPAHLIKENGMPLLWPFQEGR